MQSIFSKSTSRKSSKGNKMMISEPKGGMNNGGGPGGQLGQIIDSKHGDLGEFGTMKGVHRQVAFTSPPRSPHTSSSPNPPPAIPPKYTFSSTHIPRRTSSENSIDSTRYSDPDLFGQRPYGFLGGVGAGVVLGLAEVTSVVIEVARELENRGLATPMLFSNQALELGQGQGRGKLLILAYIDMLSSENHSVSQSSTKSQSFSHDLQYAKEYELAWFLRWALSRITRKKEGSREVSHGIIEWEIYEEWRGRERAASYPANAFPYLSSILPSSAYSLLKPLFHLLSRLAAHSHLSGLTPHALSSLFAPLLFNVPVSSPALVSHTSFVRAAAATEHLLLAYIRSTSRSSDLGLNDLPGRLKEWVAGYPGMVISDNDLVKGLPRKGARVVRCERATRVVRAYSKDLIATAETWPERDDWPAWERVVDRSKRGGESRPKFTAGYRRRMILKETPPLPASAFQAGDSTEYGMSELGVGVGRKARLSDVGRRRSEEEDGRFGSLAGKEWSMFEEGGFGAEGMGFGDKLRFDLTETAKLSITERRQTMNWTDFASPSGGLTRTDPALTTTLTFAKPLTNSIEQWPKDRSDLSKRLLRSDKDSVPFHHDTAVRYGEASGWEGEGEVRDSKGRVYLEEAFVDFWADLAVGGGWVERGELTFRESSWALLEYKAKASRCTEDRTNDEPRISSLYFLFEEQVPYDYQSAVAHPAEKRAFSLFTRKKKHPQSLSTSLPNLAHLAGPPERDFDRMLSNRSSTRKVTLNAPKGHEASIWHRQVSSIPTSPTKAGGGFVVKSREQVLGLASPSGTPKGSGEDGRVVDEEKPGFFSRGRASRRDRLTKRVAEETVDFEVESASGVGSPGGQLGIGGDEDKWMDILVSNGARRMARQDATTGQLRPALSQPGLPSSPRPSIRRSPSRTSTSTSPSPQQSPQRLPPQIYHSLDNSGGTHDDDIQIPHLSGFIQPSSSPSHPPSPRRERDTIHNIVDTYRDSESETEDEDTGRYSRVTAGETDEMYASDRDVEVEEVEEGGVEVMRYRHGEALHFVREEPEEGQ